MSKENISFWYLMLIENIKDGIVSVRVVEKESNIKEHLFMDIEMDALVEYIPQENIKEGYAFNWKIFESEKMSFEQIIRKPLTREQEIEVQLKAQKMIDFFSQVKKD